MPLELLIFVTSWLHSQVAKPIAPKIHCCLCEKPALLYLQWLLEQNRAAWNTSKDIRSLNASAGRFVPFFIQTMSAGMFLQRCLYWTLLAQITLSPSETKLTLLGHQLCTCLAFPRMDAVTHLDPHRQSV